MITTPKISELRKLIAEARADNKSVGFVPTMGALHAGHRSLIGRAREENDLVVVSIFVNPAQFGPQEDFAAYPRTFADDIEACAGQGADLVFHPEPDEIYPEPSLTDVLVHRIAEPMEGAQRPGHFAGVALVCAKLFNIVGACTAYFGEKDAQQLRVIRRMVFDLSMPVEVVGCPTLRDADGLALSSRNVHLGREERARALALPRALRTVAARAQEGEADVQALEAAGRDVLVAGGVEDVDYFDVVDEETLDRLKVVDGSALVCGAVRIGKTRLIDNVTITVEGR